MAKKFHYIALLVFFLVTNCSISDESVFFIPAGYTGPIMIVFDQDSGIQKEYEDGKRVFRIPKEGILETQFESNLSNTQSLSFYYVTSDDILIPIEYLGEKQLENKTQMEDTTSYVYSIWSGSSGHTNAERYKFVTFLIGSVSEIDSLLDERSSMNFEYQKFGS